MSWWQSIMGRSKRRPSLIRLGRRWTRELWACAFLLLALFLAGLFKRLGD